MSAGEIILDADVIQKHVGSADWNFSLDTSGKLLIVVRRQNVVELLNAAQFQKQVGEKVEIAKEAPRKPQDNLVAESPSQSADRPAPPTPAPVPATLVNTLPSNAPPLIEEVDLELKVGEGKNERWEPRKLMQCEGTVASISAVKKTAKGNDVMTLVIAGLPNSPESKTITPHSQFHCFHKDSLFPILKTLKAGKSRIVFQYDPTIKPDDPKKLIWQNIEGVSTVDGVEFDDGKPVKAEAKAAAPKSAAMFP